MTAAVHRTGTPSLTVPPSQNTAPVLEFNCLYTHDVRRKQKRWQDGFLRFHTFNKRVMVYDVPRNFIGDMHWAAGELVQEGDEMTLDKDGVMVQVAESVGRTETDLTELRQSAKKQQRSQGNEPSSPARPNMATPSRAMPPPASRGVASGQGTQLKHRSLNALLGTPKGPIGKAMLPTKSPFDSRYQDAENAGWEEGRPPKRQRMEPWNVVRTTTTPKPASKEAPLWARTADAKASAKKRKKAPLPAGQQRLGTKEVIDLSEDGDDTPTEFLPGFSSDAVVPPSSPPRERPSAVAARPTISQSPGPREKTNRAQQSDARTVLAPARAEESRGAGKPSRNKTREDTRPPARARGTSPPIAPPFLPPPNPEPEQPLRFSSSAPRKKTLACLGQLSRPGRGDSGSEGASKSKRKTQRELLEERLERAKKSAQQQQEADLDAVVADLEVNDDLTESKSKTPDAPAVTELARTHQAVQQPARADPVHPKHNRENRVDHVMEDEDAPTRRPRAFERVASINNGIASTKAKRAPGEPVRFTPSPTRRAVVDEQRSRPGSASSVQSLPDAAPSPSKVSKEPAPLSSEVAAPSARDPSPPQQLIERAPAQPPPQIAESMPPPARPPRRKAGIGRKEIRMSAQACFPSAVNTAAANGTSTVMLSKPFSAPRPPAQPKPPPTSREVGPWSREAFDLFEWRPPNWDEDKWCVAKDGAAFG